MKHKILPNSKDIFNVEDNQLGAPLPPSIIEASDPSATTTSITAIEPTK